MDNLDESLDLTGHLNKEFVEQLIQADGVSWDSWSVFDWCARGLLGLTDFTGMPLCGTIALVTIVGRIVLFPLYIAQQKHSMRSRELTEKKYCALGQDGSENAKNQGS